MSVDRSVAESRRVFSFYDVAAERRSCECSYAAVYIRNGGVAGRVCTRSRTACARERMLHDTFPSIDVTSGRSFKFVEETRSPRSEKDLATERRNAVDSP